MENKNSIETIGIIVLILFVAMIWLVVYKLDKARCEKNGGVYIWEYSDGSKCHLKGEQK